MRSDFELAVQLDSAVDRLLWGDAIVAVDTATPANASAQSNRVEETAR